MMANAVQALDPVTSWPLEDGSLPEREKVGTCCTINLNHALSHSLTFPCTLSRSLLTSLWVRDQWRRRERRQRGIPAGNKVDEKMAPCYMTSTLYVCMHVFDLKPLPCCDHSYKTSSPADHSGTPRGISAREKQVNKSYIHMLQLSNATQHTTVREWHICMQVSQWDCLKLWMRWYVTIYWRYNSLYCTKTHIF